MKSFILKAWFTVTLVFLASCSSGGSGGITYITLDYPGVAGTSSLITGIRGVDNSTDVYISGIHTPPGGSMMGFLYTGPISGGGTFQPLMFPSSPGITVSSTALYGPNNGENSGEVQIVGDYTTSENGSGTLGLLYQGPTDGSGLWSTLNPQALEIRPVINTIAHSTNGGLVVGNYDTDLITGKAFIDDIASDSYFEITQLGVASITAYGIWYNGGTSYTIAGGYSNVDNSGLSIAYVADYDSSTQIISNWTPYTYNNLPSVLTHFEGITTDNQGGYNLIADWLSPDDGTAGAAFVNIPRTSANTFGTATWTDVAFPGAEVTSGNTVYLNYALGVYRISGEGVTHSYVATIPN